MVSALPPCRCEVLTRTRASARGRGSRAPIKRLPVQPYIIRTRAAAARIVVPRCLRRYILLGEAEAAGVRRATT